MSVFLQAQTGPNLCQQDLNSIPAFLLANDAGARTHLARLGQKHFDDALQHGLGEAAQAATPSACQRVIRDYLREWRKGHLTVRVIEQGEKNDASKPALAPTRVSAPSYRELSEKTILLSLPSFGPSVRAALRELIKQNHEALASHPNWILDVRGNDGGSDSSYTSLLSWLMPDEWTDSGMEWLATPANIQGHLDACALYAPGDAECLKEMNATAAKLAKAAPQTWVPDDEQGAESYGRAEAVESRRPARVAVLIDQDCISACESFVLQVRQSFAVKLLGQHTYGALDYSNLRPHTLPSGTLRIWYATSRSTSVADFSVDLEGVPPDIFLAPEKGEPDPQKEIARVRRWLEGGSLKPMNTAK